MVEAIGLPPSLVTVMRQLTAPPATDGAQVLMIETWPSAGTPTGVSTGAGCSTRRQRGSSICAAAEAENTLPFSGPSVKAIRTLFGTRHWPLAAAESGTETVTENVSDLPTGMVVKVWTHWKLGLTPGQVQSG